MERVTKRWANFYFPGMFVANETERDVASLDPHSVAWPDGAYAFALYERTELHDGPDVYTGKAQRVGPLYYHPDSKVETLAEVEANRPGERILISNMRCNGWSAVVWSRYGNWPRPFDPAQDQVLQRA